MNSLLNDIKNMLIEEGVIQPRRLRKDQLKTRWSISESTFKRKVGKDIPIPAGTDIGGAYWTPDQIDRCELQIALRRNHLYLATPPRMAGTNKGGEHVN
jgi:hypothetical protein